MEDMLPPPTDDKQGFTGVKGFGMDMTCRGFKYSFGSAYKMEGPAVVCRHGFHAMSPMYDPIRVFDFYPPPTSRYARVRQSGDIHVAGAKTASTEIAIGDELSLSDVATLGAEYAIRRARKFGHVIQAADNRCVAVENRPDGAALAVGIYCVAMTTHGCNDIAQVDGVGAVAISAGGGWGWGRSIARAYNDRSTAVQTVSDGVAHAIGDSGVAVNTGSRGAATSDGFHGVSIATGNNSAAQSSGYGGVAIATAYNSTARSGGESGAAIAVGRDGMVRGDVDGVALFARQIGDAWTSPRVIGVACGITGVGGIKAGVWYRCVGSALVEVEGQDHGGN